MTISLSTSPSQFLQDFDSTCERIYNTKQDPIFFNLVTALIDNFHKQPLFKEFIQDLDLQLAQDREIYHQQSLELIEQARLSLCQNPQIREKERKTLEHIKKTFHSRESLPAPLQVKLMTRLQKVAFSMNTPLINPFYDPKLTDHHKQEHMQRLAATYPSFCLDRLRFLRKLGDYVENAPEKQVLEGALENIQIPEWVEASTACEEDLERIAYHSLKRKFALPPQVSLDTWLPVEYQIHRVNYESYLRSWQDHIHNQLIQMKSRQRLEINTKKIGKTQRASFAIEITSQCWQNNCNAKRADVYAYYCNNCPSGSKPFSLPHWSRIVRKNKLDPRSKKEKVRGKGK